MERLRQPTHVVQGFLGDLGDLAQVSTQRRRLRRLLAGAPQHGTNGRQDLTELVMQFA